MKKIFLITLLVFFAFVNSVFAIGGSTAGDGGSVINGAPGSSSNPGGDCNNCVRQDSAGFRVSLIINGVTKFSKDYIPTDYRNSAGGIANEEIYVSGKKNGYWGSRIDVVKKGNAQLIKLNNGLLTKKVMPEYENRVKNRTVLSKVDWMPGTVDGNGFGSFHAYDGYKIVSDVFSALRNYKEDGKSDNGKKLLEYITSSGQVQWVANGRRIKIEGLGYNYSPEEVCGKEQSLYLLIEPMIARIDENYNRYFLTVTELAYIFKDAGESIGHTNAWKTNSGQVGSGFAKWITEAMYVDSGSATAHGTGPFAGTEIKSPVEPVSLEQSTVCTKYSSNQYDKLICVCKDGKSGDNCRKKYKSGRYKSKTNKCMSGSTIDRDASEKKCLASTVKWTHGDPNTVDALVQPGTLGKPNQSRKVSGWGVNWLWWGNAIECNKCRERSVTYNSPVCSTGNNRTFSLTETFPEAQDQDGCNDNLREKYTQYGKKMGKIGDKIVYCNDTVNITYPQKYDKVINLDAKGLLSSYLIWPNPNDQRYQLTITAVRNCRCVKDGNVVSCNNRKNVDNYGKQIHNFSSTVTISYQSGEYSLNNVALKADDGFSSYSESGKEYHYEFTKTYELDPKTTYSGYDEKQRKYTINGGNYGQLAISGKMIQDGILSGEIKLNVKNIKLGGTDGTILNRNGKISTTNATYGAYSCPYNVAAMPTPNPTYCWKGNQKIDVTDCINSGKTFAACEKELCGNGSGGSCVACKKIGTNETVNICCLGNSSDVYDHYCNSDGYFKDEELQRDAIEKVGKYCACEDPKLGTIDLENGTTSVPLNNCISTYLKNNSALEGGVLGNNHLDKLQNAYNFCLSEYRTQSGDDCVCDIGCGNTRDYCYPSKGGKIEITDCLKEKQKQGMQLGEARLACNVEKDCYFCQLQDGSYKSLKSCLQSKGGYSEANYRACVKQECPDEPNPKYCRTDSSIEITSCYESKKQLGEEKAIEQCEIEAGCYRCPDDAAINAGMPFTQDMIDSVSGNNLYDKINKLKEKYCLSKDCPDGDCGTSYTCPSPNQNINITVCVYKNIKQGLSVDAAERTCEQQLCGGNLLVRPVNLKNPFLPTTLNASVTPTKRNLSGSSNWSEKTANKYIVKDSDKLYSQSKPELVINLDAATINRIKADTKSHGYYNTSTTSTQYFTNVLGDSITCGKIGNKDHGGC